MSDVSRQSEWLTGTDRYRLVAALAVGIFVGLTPLAFSLGRPWSWILIGVIAVGAPAYETGIIDNTRDDRPGLGEHARASATIGFYAQGIALLSGVVWLIGWAIASVDENNQEDWAYWVWFGAMALAGSYLLRFSSWAVGVDMWPPNKETRSRFKDSVPLGRTRFVLLGVVVALGGFVLWWITDRWIDASLFVGVFLATFLATPASQDTYDTEGYVATVERVSRTLAAMGFEVISSPTADDVEVDSALRGVDLFASLGTTGFAVDVRLRAGPYEWPDATSIIVAAQVLTDWLEDTPEGFHVDPLLVLVDARANKYLPDWARENSLNVVEVRSTGDEDPVVHSVDHDEELRQFCGLFARTQTTPTRAKP